MRKAIYGVWAAGVLAVGVLGSGPARAVENWTVYDLGAARTPELCLAAGEMSLLDYANTMGARKVVRRGDTFYAWQLAMGNHDAVLMCAEAGNRTSARLVVYSDDNEEAVILTRRIAESFYVHLPRLTKEWVDEALREAGF